MKHINMEEFANGAFTVQVNRAMEKVMKNIQDPNTDAKATRKITVTIAFKPNETRNFVATGVVAKTSLAPELGAVTTMTCGTNLKTGNIEAKTTANYGDDGVTQKTTIQQGVASRADVIVPNPVSLIPYRTFLEITQPESSFVFRIDGSDNMPEFTLIEADGGLWVNQAKAEIKKYLEKNLKELGTNIVIMA